MKRGSSRTLCWRDARAVALRRRALPRRPLAGYWPMYEGKGQVVHDISGNGNHGRLGSSNSTDGRDADWVRGLWGIGTALQFDGNDYIAIPDDTSLHQQRLTVEAWTRRNGSPGQWKYLVAKGGDGCEAASYGAVLVGQRRHRLLRLRRQALVALASGQPGDLGRRVAPRRRHVRRQDGPPLRRRPGGRRRHAVHREDQVRAAVRRGRDRLLPRGLQAHAERRSSTRCASGARRCRSRRSGALINRGLRPRARRAGLPRERDLWYSALIAPASRAGLAAPSSPPPPPAARTSRRPPRRVGASTITRTSGSVPLGRTSTRPRPSSAAASRSIASRAAAVAAASARAVGHADVDEPLRQLLHRVALGEVGARERLERQQRRRDAVAGGHEAHVDDVARLLAAERPAALAQRLEHVAVADRAWWRPRRRQRASRCGSRSWSSPSPRRRCRAGGRPRAGAARRARSARRRRRPRRRGRPRACGRRRRRTRSRRRGAPSRIVLGERARRGSSRSRR